MQIEKRCIFQRDSGTDFQAMKEALLDKMSGKPLLTTCSESSDEKAFDGVCTVSKRRKLQQIAGNKSSLLTHSIEF